MVLLLTGPPRPRAHTVVARPKSPNGIRVLQQPSKTPMADMPPKPSKAGKPPSPLASKPAPTTISHSKPPSGPRTSNVRPKTPTVFKRHFSCRLPKFEDAKFFSLDRKKLQRSSKSTGLVAPRPVPAAPPTLPTAMASTSCELQPSVSARLCHDDSSIYNSPRRVLEHACSTSTSSYELSDDFRQRQVAALERKYGGRIVSRRAALVIQRAWRQHCMQRRFSDICRQPSSSARSSARSHHLDPSLRLAVARLPRDPTALPTDPSRVSVEPNSNKVVYEFSDADIFASAPQRRQNSLAYRSHQHQQQLARGRRSKSIDRTARSTAKILSDRVEVLGESPKLRAPREFYDQETQKLEEMQLDDPYSARRNLTQLQLQQQTHAKSPSPIWLPRDSSTPVCTCCDQTDGSTVSGELCRSQSKSTVADSGNHTGSTPSLDHVASPSVETPSDILDASSSSIASSTTFALRRIKPPTSRSSQSGASGVQRPNEAELKRMYRIGLNFFNKRPDRGIALLIRNGFIDFRAESVAHFLFTRKGISKSMIGEYLGTLQQPFNQAVLEAFVSAFDFTNLELDVALRHFQTYFRLPGEAQKIERIVQVFADRFVACNQRCVSRAFLSEDTVFVLAFAVIMLNTDLHSPNVKSERKMKLEEFVRNLRGVDQGQDIDEEYLTGIYQRVRAAEFRTGADHVSQVQKVDRNVVGKKPTLSVPHRRLVCYCRLYEVTDPHRKQAVTAHQREIFLFNDMILITKILSKKKSGVTYSFRDSHSLTGMQISSFQTPHYQHGIRVVNQHEGKILLFNARNDDDRTKFMEDLKESVLESNDMETLRIEHSLEHQGQAKWSVFSPPSLGRGEAQRDSGFADAAEVQPRRAPSVNSLDSGMSSNASLDSSSSPAGASKPKPPRVQA